VKMRRIALTLAVLSALCVCGCGGSGVVVTGTVKFGGNPLSVAVVTLEPERGSGTTGPGALVWARGGRFRIDSSRNLKPGKYVVRVSQTPLDPSQAQPTIPPRFQAWETKTELTAQGATLDLDVPLSNQ
jgi:hypothetical protein